MEEMRMGYSSDELARLAFMRCSAARSLSIAKFLDASTLKTALMKCTTFRAAHSMMLGTMGLAQPNIRTCTHSQREFANFWAFRPMAERPSATA